jgi:hypothetical protein
MGERLERIADAARQAFSLEGLVIALIGGGVWLVATATGPALSRCVRVP